MFDFKESFDYSVPYFESISVYFALSKLDIKQNE